MSGYSDHPSKLKVWKREKVSVSWGLSKRYPNCPACVQRCRRSPSGPDIYAKFVSVRISAGNLYTRSIAVNKAFSSSGVNS